MFWDGGSPICLSKTQLSCKSGEGAHLSEGVNCVGWDTNHSIIYPLFFGFSFLLPELKKRKEPLTDVTFESSVTENGGCPSRAYASLQDACNLTPGTLFCDQASWAGSEPPASSPSCGHPQSGLFPAAFEVGQAE